MATIHKYLDLQPDDRYKKYSQVSTGRKFDHVKQTDKRLDLPIVYTKAAKFSSVEKDSILAVLGEKLKVFNYEEDLSRAVQ